MGSSPAAPTRQPLATTEEVAAYLQLEIGTLDQWAWQGIGPRYTKAGRRRRYRWEDVDDWLRSRSSDGEQSAESRPVVA